MTTVSTDWEEPVAPMVARGGNTLALKVVCIGGGTGLPVVLKGLARRAEAEPGQAPLQIKAVVAMSDDGGSSGRLRRHQGVLPPGDIRNCLVALASGTNPLKDLFQFRFGGEKGLKGHTLGNLLIVGFAQIRGDFLEAVRLTGRMLRAKGEVIPATLSSVELVAEKEGAGVIPGEWKIGHEVGRVVRVQLRPSAPPPTKGLLCAIAEAELITLGPGSLYSSLLPNLLVDGVAEALKGSRALKVLVANLMTQPGETDGMSCFDHVKAIVDHVGHVVDVVLLNATPVSQDAVARYESAGSTLIPAELESLKGLGVIPVQADLLHDGRRVRHDSGKLARCLLKLARMGP